jgi:hypothetical protein
LHLFIRTFYYISFLKYKNNIDLSYKTWSYLSGSVAKNFNINIAYPVLFVCQWAFSFNPKWTTQVHQSDVESHRIRRETDRILCNTMKSLRIPWLGITSDSAGLYLIGYHSWIDSRIRQPGKWRPSTVYNTH